jgi:replicative superfamily II helicase
MRRIDAGISGVSSTYITSSWYDLKLKGLWPHIIDTLNPGPNPREIQYVALKKYKVLENRRNLIISAPTNSGKSLIGILILLESILSDRRAVLVTPLRAIAREKFDELKSLAPSLENALGRKLKVSISTGDYRLENETYDAPPTEGEIIITTPERFDAIIRNPSSTSWLSSIGSVCVDEAHLIVSPNRGPALEYLITSLICLPAPPRLVLLSATLGNADRAQDWLAPCDVIKTDHRYPELHKEVWALGEGDDANKAVVEFAKNTLTNKSSSILIFVYQTKSAERLATLLRNSIGEQAGLVGPLAYHSQMNAAQRNSVREAFRTMQSKCVVATTALGLGVNLPATHVFIRDNTFPGVGPLSIADMLQMLGRAGRGDCIGKSVILVRKNDFWRPQELADAIRTEEVKDFLSSLEDAPHYRKQNKEINETEIIATCIATQLSRHSESGLSAGELQNFFKHSLSGHSVVSKIPVAIAWLNDTSRTLAYKDDSDKYHLTALGMAATRSILPLNIAGGFGQLLRDILTIDPYDDLLAHWQSLDYLIVISLFAKRYSARRPFSENLVDQIDSWMERHPQQTPLLYKQWVFGQSGSSKAVEVLGSLGLSPSDINTGSQETARRDAYRAILRSVVLYELGQGKPIEILESEWKLKDLEGLEERWRDENLWLLSGIKNLLDIKCFYFHLLNECQASPERVKRIKCLFNNMRSQAFEMLDRLKYCSPLGALLHEIRRSVKPKNGVSIGFLSIKKLEQAGIHRLQDLAMLGLKDLCDLGIRGDLAKQILSYLRKRLL